MPASSLLVISQGDSVTREERTEFNAGMSACFLLRFPALPLGGCGVRFGCGAAGGGGAGEEVPRGDLHHR